MSDFNYKRSVFCYPRLSVIAVVFSVLFILSNVTVSAQLPVIKQGENLASPFAHVYEKIAPSVVRIDVKAVISQNDQLTRNPWQFFFETPPQKRKPVEGMGSGVIIDRDGHILTNNHVIAGADEITVKVNENETYDAEVIGTDPESDLAVVKMKLDGKKLPANYVARLGDSDTLKPGDYAIAIGNPIGLDRSISVGVISALGRHGLNVMGGSLLRFQDFIQTDAQINPGNSGGALADINGNVIGINNLYTAYYAGIGFAIPINLAKNVMNQLIASGEVKRGFVGIRASAEGITKEIQEALELSGREGVLIEKVMENSPAESAGLEHGDVIVSLDGKNVKDFRDFLFRVADHSPGDTVKLVIIRDKKEKTVTLTLTDSASFLATHDSNAVNWRGIYVVDLNKSVVERYNLGDLIKSGVVVVKIDEDSPAAKVNLRPGDVIVEIIEIENREIKDLSDFKKIKSNPKLAKKTILIYRKRVESNGEISPGFVAVKSK